VKVDDFDRFFYGLVYWQHLAPEGRFYGTELLVVSGNDRYFAASPEITVNAFDKFGLVLAQSVAGREKSLPILVGGC
jgi:hypothetical protein